MTVTQFRKFNVKTYAIRFITLDLPYRKPLLSVERKGETVETLLLVAKIADFASVL